MNMFESEPLNSNMMKLFDFHNQDVMFVLYCMTSCTHVFIYETSKIQSKNSIFIK